MHTSVVIDYLVISSENCDGHLETASGFHSDMLIKLGSVACLIWTVDVATNAARHSRKGQELIELTLHASL